MSETLDFTCVLNCHDEGILAHRAVKSILAMMNVARNTNYVGELLVVFDKVPIPSETRSAAAHAAEYDEPTGRSIDVELGDLGLARNAAVDAARGRFVFFFDADDVWGDEWLVKGLHELYRCAAAGVSAVVHPQLIMNFGADKLYWQHTDCRDPKFDPSTFMITNHWTANCGAARKLFLSHPYRAASKESGFGFEDWEWNARTWAAGVAHVVVPETAHFIRKHLGSMSRSHAAQGRTIQPGGIFATPRQATPATEEGSGTFFGPHEDIFEKLGPARELVIGDWAHDMTKRVHQIEPEIWADPRDYLERKLYHPPGVPAAWDAYWSLREAILESEPTHVILGAGIGGGADTRVRFYADRVRKNGGRPVVIWTGGKGGVVPGATTIEGADVAKTTGLDTLALILGRNMIELNPGTIVHVVNSNAAYNALAMTARQIKSAGVRVFASFYAIEKNRDGQCGGYAVNGGLTAANRALEAVITDSRSFAEELEEQTGWPVTRTHFVPMVAVPLEMPDEERPVRNGLRLLWAGRTEWAKDPGLLLALAPKLNVALTVVAAPGDEYGLDVKRRLAALGNVMLLSPWTGPLPIELAQEHDALIITSWHEGMPNLALEAMRLGLPIVSTHVGGMRDLNGSTFVETVPVESRDDPEAWLRALSRLETRRRASRRAADYLTSEHSEVAADAALRKAGYLK